jgi:hypothetical protein
MRWLALVTLIACGHPTRQDPQSISNAGPLPDARLDARIGPDAGLDVTNRSSVRAMVRAELGRDTRDELVDNRTDACIELAQAPDMAAARTVIDTRGTELARMLRKGEYPALQESMDRVNERCLALTTWYEPP